MVAGWTWGERGGWQWLETSFRVSVGIREQDDFLISINLNWPNCSFVLLFPFIEFWRIYKFAFQWLFLDSIFMFDQYQLTPKSLVMVLASLLPGLPWLHCAELPWALLSIPLACPSFHGPLPALLPVRRSERRKPLGTWHRRRERLRGRESKSKTGGPGEFYLITSNFCHNFFLFLSSVLRKRQAVGKCVFSYSLSCPITVRMMDSAEQPMWAEVVHSRPGIQNGYRYSDSFGKQNKTLPSPPQWSSFW